MTELYRNTKGTVHDEYMAILVNKDGDLPGHLPYYDVTICPDGELMHGQQWSQEELDTLHKRIKNGTSVFVRVEPKDVPKEVQNSLVKEIMQ